MVITPIDRHIHLNKIEEFLIDTINQGGHGDGTYRGNVSYYSHGEQLH